MNSSAEHSEFNYILFTPPSSRTNSKDGLWVECIQKPHLQFFANHCCFAEFPKGSNVSVEEWTGNAIRFLISTGFGAEITLGIVVSNQTLIFQIDQVFKNEFIFLEDALELLNANIRNEGNFIGIHFASFSFGSVSGPEIVDSTESSKKILDFIDLAAEYNYIWTEAEKWIQKLPNISRYVKPMLWQFPWVISRLNRKPIIQKSLLFSNHNTFELQKLPEALSTWELLHVIDDLMWYNSKKAKEFLIDIFSKRIDSDGRIKSTYNDTTHLSVPPLWSFILLDFTKYSGYQDIIHKYYQLCQKNITWWEKNRYFPEFHLFGAELSVKDFGIETEMINSPRFSRQFDGKNWNRLSKDKIRKLLLVDLNSQMCDYYQNMGVLGLIAGDNLGSEHYFKKADRLQQYAQTVLWDPKKHFYFDYDIEIQELQSIKTIAGFWPIYGGLATKEKVVYLIHHLTDKNEFWCEFPVPSVALDEKFFSRKVGHGPVSISQNFWLVNGLRRYDANEIATSLAKKIFSYLNVSFKLYGGIYQFYPPNSYNVFSIPQNTHHSTIPGYELGYAPLHSIFYRGIVGAEILDDSINFACNRELSEDVNFSFNYRGKLHQAYLSQFDKKIQEFEG
ncbi:MAG: MGH1-like glycoside hydrolase domain-containing protein [Promethearchaeota archaeon]